MAGSVGFSPVQTDTTLRGDLEDEIADRQQADQLLDAAKLDAGLLGVPGGVATLDDSGRLVADQSRSATLGTTFTDVANEAAMLALDAETGDFAQRIDGGGSTWRLVGDDPTVLADWQLFESGFALAVDVANKAEDDEVVHLTGDETITGAKDFATLKQDGNDVLDDSLLGAANGIAQLGADGIVLGSQIPVVTTNATHVVANEAAMLALTAAVGDIAVRTDQANAKYMLLGADESVLANWSPMAGDAVTQVQFDALSGTVAGKQGAFTVVEVDDADYTVSSPNIFVRAIAQYGTRTVTLSSGLAVGAEVIISLETVGTTKQLNIALPSSKFGSPTGSGSTSLVSAPSSLHLKKTATHWAVIAGHIPESRLTGLMDSRDTTALNSAKAYADERVAAVQDQISGAGDQRVLGSDGVSQWFLRQNDEGDFILDPLKYARPDFTGWKVIQFTDATHYTVNGGASTVFAGTFDFGVSEDVVIYFPSNAKLGRKGGIRIEHGRNIALIGGEVRVDTDVFPETQANGDPPTSDYRGIYFVNQYGDIYLEGVQIHGTRLGDAIDVSHSLTNACNVTMQNCIIGDIAGGGGTSANSIAHAFGGIETTTGVNYTSELHADCLQFFDTTNANMANVKVRIYQCIWRSAYQGLTVNDIIGKGWESERWVMDMQSTLYWNGEQRSGYAVGIYTSNENTMPLEFGAECIVYDSAGSTKTTGVWPPDHPKAAALPVTHNAWANPAWIRSDYGQTYAANKPEPVTLGSGVGSVSFGVTAGTARPNVNGVVFWSGDAGTSVRPTNKTATDLWVDA